MRIHPYILHVFLCITMFHTGLNADLLSKIKYSLDECIEIALMQSPELTGASQQLEIAEISLKQAQAQYRPKMGLNLSYGINFDDELDVSDGELSGGIFINYDIFGNLYRRSNLERAKLNLEMAKLQKKQMETRVISSVIKGFYDILKYEKEELISSQSVELAEKNYRQIQIRYESGSADKLDLTSAEMTLKETQSGLMLVRHGLDQKHVEFQILLGMSDIEKIKLTPEKVKIIELEDIQKYLDYGMTNRVDVKISQQNIKMAELTLKYAKLGKLPKLNLFTTANVPISGSSDANFVVTPNLYWQIYDAGDVQFQIEYAEKNLLSTKTSHQILLNKVTQDIQKTYYSMIDSIRTYNLTKERVLLAETRLKKSEIQLAAGDISKFEFENINQDYNRLKIQLLFTEYDMAIAQAILQEVTGTRF